MAFASASVLLLGCRCMILHSIIQMSTIVRLRISTVLAIMHIFLEGKVIILSVISILILFGIDSL